MKTGYSIIVVGFIGILLGSMGGYFAGSLSINGIKATVSSKNEQIATLTNQANQLTNQITVLQKEDNKVPALQQQISTLQSQYSSLQSQYNLQISRTVELVYDKQDQTSYCGEACIQMILGYYNREPLPSQTEIATEVNFRENITYTSDMPKPFITRNMGYTISQTTDFDSAYNSLITTVSGKPVIILITWQNGIGHYFVVYGGDANGIRYDDPLYGSNMYLTKSQLKLLWHDNCISHPPQPADWMLIVG